MQYIEQWLYLNEKLRELNKFLYEHTELFEEKYMSDYKEELYSFFAGKITRFTNDYNRLFERLSIKEQKEIQKIKLLRR